MKALNSSHNTPVSPRQNLLGALQQSIQSRLDWAVGFGFRDLGV